MLKNLIHDNGSLEQFVASATRARSAFERNGYYCSPKRSSDEIVRFWAIEAYRCKNGYNAFGYTIPGEFYYYLNYCPIQVVSEDETGKDERHASFPDFWELDYDFFHKLSQAQREKKDIVVLKRRGIGFSFKLAALMNYNYHIYKGSTSFCFVDRQGYWDEDGIYPKIKDIHAFNSLHCEWGGAAHINQKGITATRDDKKDGSWISGGSKSKIISKIIAGDSSKARGSRGRIVGIDEAGSFKKLLETVLVTNKSINDGNRKFGMMVIGGTGGDENADSSSGLETLFNHPNAYGFLSCENTFDDPHTAPECGIFYPAQYNLTGFYNPKTGITDLEAATKFLDNKIEQLKSAGDPNMVAKEYAEMPRKPSQAMLKVSTSDFPRLEIIERLTELEVNQKKYRARHNIGYFKTEKDGSLSYVPTDEIAPIYKFPHSARDKKPGAPIMYAPPERDSNGNIPYARYIGGVDSLDHDQSTTTSLFSFYILDRFTDKIVFEYTGRPAKIKDAYKLCLNAARFYNALLNVENHNIGIIEYFDLHKGLQYLCEPLRLITGKYSSNKTKRSKGTAPNDAVNAWGRQLLGEWFLAINPVTNETNISSVDSEPLLQEALLWNNDSDKANFDRVSAAGMLFLLREDLLRVPKTSATNVKTESLLSQAKDDIYYYL